MIKKILIISLLVVFIASGIVVPLPAYAFTPIPISATSAVLMDSSTNQLLYAKNLNMKRAPASTTKLLTALVVLDQLDLNSVVTVPQFAEGVEPSKIHLKWGEKYRTRDLVKATLINSANDAAETLAVAAAGSSPEFANLMNKKARSLGCRDSHFVRASGLPAEDQYSTALDMALIMQAARKNQFLFDTLKTKTTTITSLDGRRIFLKNHNKMLLRGNNEVIGKTGWTRTAKHCFVGQIKLFGRKAIISILGSRSAWKDLRTIMRYQFGSGAGIAQTRKSGAASPANENKKLQMALRRAGYYSGPVNGKFGPATKLALKQFQKAKGLTADGIPGELTRKALSNYY
jgi:D-alanyl-D-alanine carboxypeptidase